MPCRVSCKRLQSDCQRMMSDAVGRADESLTVDLECFAWQASASQPHLQVGSEGMQVWSLHYQPARKCWQLSSCGRLRTGQPSMLCAPDQGRTIYLSDDNSRMRADWRVGPMCLCTFLPSIQLLSDSLASFWLLLRCHTKALSGTCSKSP